MISATPELSLEPRRFPSGVRPLKPGRTGKGITGSEGEWGGGEARGGPSPKQGRRPTWEGLSSLRVSWAVQPSGVEEGWRRATGLPWSVI